MTGAEVAAAVASEAAAAEAAAAAAAATTAGTTAAAAAPAAAMTAAEAASLGAPELLASGQQAGLLAAQNVGLPGAAETTNAALASNPQALMLHQQTGLLGGIEATNAAADPALTQGMQQPWYQQAMGWLGEKPLGSGPSRGKMLQMGAGQMGGGQPQQAPAPHRAGGQYHPVAQGSPYANGTTLPPEFVSMADFLKRRY